MCKSDPFLSSADPTTARFGAASPGGGWGVGVGGGGGGRGGHIPAKGGVCKLVMIYVYCCTVSGWFFTANA